MEKDMSGVERYEMARKRDMLLFNSLNNAATLLAGSFAGGNVKLVTAKGYVDFAIALYDEVIARDYLNYCKIQDNRTIDKKTGKAVESPNSAVGGVPVILTEKEGKEIGVNFPESEEDYKENDVVI